MIENRIQEIESKIQDTKNISEESRRELLSLLATLKSEISRLESTHAEDARSISRFADASAHEATRGEKKPLLLAAALQGLTSSVEGLESSHPAISQSVNRIATALSNMGI